MAPHRSNGRNEPPSPRLAHIADMVRWLRGQRGFTQENLAYAANLTWRTVAYVESGRRGSDKETLRRIAKVFDVPDSIFDMPTDEDLERFARDVQRAVRKSLLVTLQRVINASNVLDLGVCHMQRSDISHVEDHEALTVAAELVDSFRDYMDIAGELSMVQQAEFACGIAADCQRLGACGYACYVGQHREVLDERALRSRVSASERAAGHLVFRVAVVTVLPASTGPTHRALVQLDGAWETHPDDRPALPGSDG